MQNSQLKFSFVEKWGSNGSGASKFVRPNDVNFDSVRPNDVNFDSKGFVYVSDRELNNIQKFTHNGTFIKKWGSKGSDDGQFRVPYSIGVIKKWGSKGSDDGQFRVPYSIGVDPKIKIYVVDREKSSQTKI